MHTKNELPSCNIHNNYLNLHIHFSCELPMIIISLYKIMAILFSHLSYMYYNNLDVVVIDMRSDIERSYGNIKNSIHRK